jgi:large subunit ribosomal protein L25
MKTAEMNVKNRDQGTKTAVRTLRRSGFVPANMYGPGLKNQVFAVNEIEFRKTYGGAASSNLLLTLRSESNDLNGKRVILKQLERDPVTWRPLHVDFLEVAVDRPLTVDIPLEFDGVPTGVKLDGGLLQIIRRSVQLRALPDNIPPSIKVDISGIGLNETLHISDLKLPANCELTDDAKYSVVSVIETKEEAATPVAAAAEGAVVGEGAAAAASTATAAPAEKKAEKKAE